MVSGVGVSLCGPYSLLVKSRECSISQLTRDMGRVTICGRSKVQAVRHEVYVLLSAAYYACITCDVYDLYCAHVYSAHITVETHYRSQYDILPLNNNIPLIDDYLRWAVFHEGGNFRLRLH